MSELEGAVKTAASSSELEAKARELSDAMSASVADLRTKVADASNRSAIDTQIQELSATIASTADALRAELQAKIEQNAEVSSATVATLKEELSAQASVVASTKEQLVSQMDSNGDGTIDKSEFTVWAGEHASRVDALEKRIETALDAAKSATEDVHRLARLRH